MPDKITVRYLISHGSMLIVEHDDETVHHGPGPEGALETPEGPGSVIKGIETVLSTIGYTLNTGSMYMDSDLIVAHFHRESA